MGIVAAIEMFRVKNIGCIRLWISDVLPALGPIQLRRLIRNRINSRFVWPVIFWRQAGGYRNINRNTAGAATLLL